MGEKRFKKGDFVKVVRSLTGKDQYVGKVGQISYVDPSYFYCYYPYLIEEITDEKRFDDRELELVESSSLVAKPFWKFKPGDSVIAVHMTTPNEYKRQFVNRKCKIREIAPWSTPERVEYFIGNCNETFNEEDLRFTKFE
jgi:hypothetical protein